MTVHCPFCFLDDAFMNASLGEHESAAPLRIRDLHVMFDWKERCGQRTDLSRFVHIFETCRIDSVVMHVSFVFFESISTS